MKKKLILAFCLSAFFLFSLVSALDITLSKSSYFPGETLQAEIPDAFINNLNINSIKIYQGNQVHSIPAESGLVKSPDEGKYLFYAILPTATGDYSLKIENAAHYEGTQQTSNAIVLPFSIVSANSSYLSFNPGYISASHDFSIKVKAYGSNQQINVNFPTTGFSQTFNLGNGNEKTVYFSIAGINSLAKSTISIGSYSIPAIISLVANEAPVQNTTIINGTNMESNISIIPEAKVPIEDLVYIYPSKINATILSGQDYYFEINLYSKTNDPLGNLSVSSPNGEIKSNVERISLSRERINITISAAKQFSGSINLSSSADSMIIPVNILVTENETKVVVAVSNNDNCTENEGVVCDSSKNEECQGIIKPTFDAPNCCIGGCAVKKSSSAWIWGIVIFAVLGLGAWYLYNKSKKSPNQKPSELLKKKSEEYESRMNPTEVRKSLSKE